MIYGHSTAEMITIAVCAFGVGAIVGGILATIWAMLK